MSTNAEIPTKIYPKKIWPIGGGKGGVGKSVITANLGLAIANQVEQKNKDVLLLDADLGSGNLHNYLGIKYRKFTLNDFIVKHKKTLKEIIIDSPLENLKLISGGIEGLNLANLNYQQKERLLRNIKLLRADYILMDLAPSSHYNTIDFFALSNNGIIVTTPEPPAIQSSYGFLKNVVYRKLTRFFRKNKLAKKILKDTIKDNESYNAKKIRELIYEFNDIDSELAFEANKIIRRFRPQLIINMVDRSFKLSLVEKYQRVIKKYLDINIPYLGHIAFDKKVKKSTKSLSPVLLKYPNSKAAHCLFKIAEKLIAQKTEQIL